MQVICADTTPIAFIQDLEIGDSIAVDGICLTVTQILTHGFLAAVSPETLGRTTLSSGHETLVNLEASLKVGSKLGGHFVTGHVDGVGYLESSVQTAIAWDMTFSVADAQVARYIVSKGSIAVNGISLTIAACDDVGSWFRVAVIPHTYAETNLHLLMPGSPVNLEGDILGKYIEKLLRVKGSHPAIHTNGESSPTDVDSLSPAFLAEHGYF